MTGFVSASEVYFGGSFLDVNICESPACVHRQLRYETIELPANKFALAENGRWLLVPSLQWGRAGVAESILVYAYMHTY
jgi:hypothetical protein